MISRVIYLIIFISTFNCIKATNDSCLKITDSQWEKKSKEKNYIETYQEFEEKENKSGNSIKKMPTLDLGGFKYVFYLLIGGAILFILIKIIQNINASPAIDIDKDRVYTLAEVEDKILEVDLDRILAEALLDQDYRLALRINFLIIIKMLAVNGNIIWKKEKTNWEYFNEVKDKNIALKFKEIITPFETIWYGEHELNENQYMRLQPMYESFKVSYRK